MSEGTSSDVAALFFSELFWPFLNNKIYGEHDNVHIQKYREQLFFNDAFCK